MRLLWLVSKSSFENARREVRSLMHSQAAMSSRPSPSDGCGVRVIQTSAGTFLTKTCGICVACHVMLYYDSLDLWHVRRCTAGNTKLLG